VPHDNLNDYLRERARERPGKVAFATPSRDWTFAQLDEASNRVAQGLKSLGIGHADRVAALTKHTAQCVVLTMAAAKLGAVCMPVNWRLAAPEIDYIIDNGQAKFLMTDASFLKQVQDSAKASAIPRVLSEASSEERSLMQWAAGFPAIDPMLAVNEHDTALQLYSSGTTGLPKGVELTHWNLLGALEASLPGALGYHGDRSIMLNALPTFHISGSGLALMTMAHGGTSVLYPEFDPARVVAGIDEHRVTHAFLVPAMIQAMLMAPGVEQADFSSLACISYGASPISDKVLVDALRIMKCNFLQVYGLTETSGAITYLPPEDHDPDGPRAWLLRACGKAGDGVEIRVVDAAGADVPEGEVGEVWIRSRQNMKGYWRNPAATEQAFPEGREAEERGGWFRSGDAGYLREGYLFIHDRIKDMIISGGENIYPAEVENALMQHPEVADCAIIGVPDEKWGEAVKACVVRRPGTHATEAQIIAFMRERIAHYKCPKSVDFMTALPRNPSGKLLKFQLRKPYWVGKDRQVN
jgi:acyl-CoA synthetase (AMP-forming)/AMP-acid ligase II